MAQASHLSPTPTLHGETTPSQADVSRTSLPVPRTARQGSILSTTSRFGPDATMAAASAAAARAASRGSLDGSGWVLGRGDGGGGGGGNGWAGSQRGSVMWGRAGSVRERSIDALSVPRGGGAGSRRGSVVVWAVDMAAEAARRRREQEEAEMDESESSEDEVEEAGGEEKGDNEDGGVREEEEESDAGDEGGGVGSERRGTAASGKTAGGRSNRLSAVGLPRRARESLASTPSSGRSGFSLARSAASSASSVSQADVLTRTIARFVQWFEQTRLYQFVLWALDTIWVQMIAVGLYYLFLVATIVVIMFVLNDHEFPNIHFYNLVHIALHIVGKNILVAGFLLANISAKGNLACALLKSSQGISLTQVTFKIGQHAPFRGRSLRKLFYVALAVVEIALWAVELRLEFTPVTLSALGTFACTPARYTKPPEAVDGMMVLMQGNMRLASVYNYGLPLVDGVVGGWSAWPKAVPAPLFSLQGPGVVYLVSGQCSHPEPVAGSAAAGTGNAEAPATNGTVKFAATGSAERRQVSRNGTVLSDGHVQVAPAVSFELLEIYNWNASLVYTVAVTLPPHTHDVTEFADHAVRMVCQSDVLVGSGMVEYSFVADEWTSVAGGQVVSITLTDPYTDADRAATVTEEGTSYLPNFDDDLVLTPGMGGTLNWKADGGAGAKGRFVGEVRERLFPLAAAQAKLTSWIGDTVYHLFTPDAIKTNTTFTTTTTTANTMAAAANTTSPATAVHRAFTPNRRSSKKTWVKKATVPTRTPYGPHPASEPTPQLAPPKVVSCGHSDASSQTCDLLSWTANPEGLIQTHLMHRGIITITSAIAHHVVMRFDATADGRCQYFGYRGHGIVEAPMWIRSAVTAGLVISLVLAASLVVAFFLLLGSKPRHVEIAATVLDDPLRLLYFVRSSLPRLIVAKLPPGMGADARSLKRYLEDVRVRFGELKEQRGEQVGMLSLDVPTSVIKLRKGRKYE